MHLSDLPTVYDYTPDYASNLADSTEMFWPGDQGRWQAANLSEMSPAASIVGWLLLGYGVGYIAYKTLNPSNNGLSGYSRRSRRRYR
jgi:hypothetical protein